MDEEAETKACREFGGDRRQIGCEELRSFGLVSDGASADCALPTVARERAARVLGIAQNVESEGVIENLRLELGCVGEYGLASRPTGPQEKREFGGAFLG